MCLFPSQFDALKARGEAMGFKYIAAGPLVRSSYKAGEFFMEHMIRAGSVAHAGADAAQA
jgi:lipoic acid synthetase